MKTKGSSVGMYTMLVAIILFMASCGNSQKKKEQAAQQQTTQQAMDSVTVIESETVVIAVDSITPDSAANQTKPATPKKTK
ncbi:MAG: hypothetical protein RR397_03790 [Odoribacter sp.]